DARGRRRAPSHRDRHDHRRSRARGAPRRCAGAAARDDGTVDQGEGGLVVVAVIGCGAVGSLFAANLATLDDVEVWAYDLAQQHVDAINRDGLRLTGAGEVVGHPRATTDATALPPCDFGIVATKAMHTAVAIAATKDAVAGAGGPQRRKVSFNAATNPLGALTGLTHGRVCERPPLRRLASQLVAEGKAVAAAQGIVLDSDPEDLIDYAARPEVAYGHKASMLQDVEARRQTEVDYLNGGIAEFGRKLGIPTPTHESIWALVKGVEASWDQ